LKEMNRKVQGVLWGLLLIGLPGYFQAWSAEDRTPRVTKEELRAMMERPETVIIDVRTGLAWKMSNQKIKGAVREDPEDPRPWVGKYSKDRLFIFYCA
jgi:rhodanese-related sulfurtransferase